MKDKIAIIGLVLTTAVGAFYAHITQNPESPARAWVDNTATPAIKNSTIRTVRAIPFSGLIKWPDGYDPRHTLRQLEAVPATATPYTAEELAEIYPSH